MAAGIDTNEIILMIVHIIDVLLEIRLEASLIFRRLEIFVAMCGVTVIQRPKAARMSAKRNVRDDIDIKGRKKGIAQCIFKG